MPDSLHSEFLKLQPEEPLGNRFLGWRWACSSPWGSARWAEGPWGVGPRSGAGGDSTGDRRPGSQGGCPEPSRHRAGVGGSSGRSLRPGGGPPPGLSQSCGQQGSAPPREHSPTALTRWGADAVPEAHRGQGGRGLARGPPASPSCLVGSLSQACWGEEAAKDSGELETPTGQRRPLPQGSCACSPRPDRPGSAQDPGEPRGPAGGPGLVCKGCPGAPRPQDGRPRDPAAHGGDPCVRQAARRLHRNVLAFVRLFPRNWGVSCAQLALSWLWLDGIRALPAGPAQVPGAFGTWGGLRPCEPLWKDQSAPFPNHLSPCSPRAAA